MRRILLVIMLGSVIACGGSTPTSPGPQPAPVPAPQPAPAPLDLSGDWLGSLRFSIDGEPFQRQVTVTLAEDDRHVVGSYSAGGTGQRGTLAFDLTARTPEATLTGTIGMDAPSTDPAIRCTGSGPIAGTASPLTVRATTIPLTNCAGVVTDVTLSMQR